MLKEHAVRLFVVTKTSEPRKQAVMDSIAGSLGRLDAPRVDAVLLNDIGDSAGLACLVLLPTGGREPAIAGPGTTNADGVSGTLRRRQPPAGHEGLSPA